MLGVANDSNKELRVKLVGSANKEVFLDKIMAPGKALEQVISPQAASIMLLVYEGEKLAFVDRVDLKNMNLPYFDVQKKESGFGFIITSPDGAVQIARDLNYFMPAGKSTIKTQPSAPAQAVPPAQVTQQTIPAPASGKYEIQGSNFSHRPSIRIELISALNGKAGQGPVIVNQALGINKSFQTDFDSKVFPLLLKVYEWKYGQEEKIFEDEIDLPAYKIPHFEFYIAEGIDKLKLGFSPDVAHGRQIAKKEAPLQQPAQSQAKPASTAPAQAIPVSRQIAPIMGGKYEVELRNGSQLPLRFRMITKTGRKLFEGELPGANPTERKEPQTPLYPVSAQDFPITVYSFDDTKTTGDFTFTFSLDEALKESAETRAFFAKSPQVIFGEENQFYIRVRDSRPTRTGPSHTVANISPLIK